MDQLHSLSQWTLCFFVTLPETNSKFAPENRPFDPIGKDRILSPSIFRGELLVSGRVTFKHDFS